MSIISRLKIFIIFLFCLPIAGQPAGKIQGRVIDSKTQKPLRDVNVLVLDTVRGDVTDSLGASAIDDVPPGVYHLRFSLLGYEAVIKSDVVVNTARPAIINAQLLETPIANEEIVVTPGYFVEEFASSVSSTQFAAEEIRRFPGGFEDIVRTAATLPGVAVVNEGGRNDLLVRGGGPSENLYLINNIEVPNINHFGSQGSSSGALSFVNLDFIDRVEFSTGGFGARYGDKMSSVLSLGIRPGRSDRLGGEATISATQFGLNLEGPFKAKGDFLFSARQSYLDLIFKAAGLPFVPRYTNYNGFRFNQIDELEREYFNSKADETELNFKLTSYFDLRRADGLYAGLAVKNIFNDNTTVFADTIYDRSGRRVPVNSLGLPQVNALNASAQKYAAYAEWEQKLSEQIDFNFGGREDDFQSFGYFPLNSRATGRAYGVELLLQKRFSEIPCDGQISLGYNQSEYTAGNGKKYPGQFDQRFIFNISGGYVFNSRWEISSKFRYFTGAPFTPVYRPAENNGAIQNLPEEYLSQRLQAGHLLDVRLDRRLNFSNWAMIVFLDVQNIYNFKLQRRPAMISGRIQLKIVTASPCCRRWESARSFRNKK
jgi:hypothetical protein